MNEKKSIRKRVTTFLLALVTTATLLPTNLSKVYAEETSALIPDPVVYSYIKSIAPGVDLQRTDLTEDDFNGIDSFNLIDVWIDGAKDLKGLNLLGKQVRSVYIKVNDSLQDNKMNLSYLNSMVNLQTFHIVSSNPHVNKVTGVNYLGNLSKLHQIWVENLDITNVESIQYLTNISDLSITQSNVNDLVYFKNLTNLNSLDLTSNDITSVSHLKDLHNLKELNLTGNNIEDISPLKSLYSIERLNLSSNNISDINPLDNLDTLIYLGLSYNNISDISPLSSLVNLKDLDLDGNSISNISPLSSLVNIKDLNLSHNNVQDVSPLQNLIKINSLYLNDNLIEYIDSLDSLGDLQTLWLRENKLISVNKLNVTNLKYLNVSENKLKDISFLSDASNLKTLYMSYNPITSLEPLRGTKGVLIELAECLITDISPIKDNKLAINGSSPDGLMGNFIDISLAENKIFPYEDMFGRGFQNKLCFNENSFDAITTKTVKSGDTFNIYIAKKSQYLNGEVSDGSGELMKSDGKDRNGFEVNPKAELIDGEGVIKLNGTSINGIKALNPGTAHVKVTVYGIDSSNTTATLTVKVNPNEVTVNAKDIDTGEVINTKKVTGNYELYKEYAFRSLNIFGTIDYYNLDDVEEKKVTLTEDNYNEDINFNYKKFTPTVKVNCIDRDTYQVFHTYFEENPKLGTNTIYAKDVEGYSLVDIESKNAYLDNSDYNQEVWFYYEKITPKGTVTIHYKDSEGNNIADDVIENGVELGLREFYNRYIYGYKSVDFSKSVLISEYNLNQEITFIYDKINPTVKVYNKDINTDEVIYEEVIDNLDLGDNYINSKNINGYTLIGDGGKSVYLSEDYPTQEIVFYYNKIPSKGSVTIHYKDSEGNTLADNKVIGDLDLGYQNIYSDSIPGYIADEAYKLVILSETNLNQEVTFVYNEIINPKVNVKYVDNLTGDVLLEETLDNVNLGDNIVFSKDIDGYTLNDDSSKVVSFNLGEDNYTKEVVFKYNKEYTKGSITVHYKDVNGNEIKPDYVYDNLGINPDVTYANTIYNDSVNGYKVVGDNYREVYLTVDNPNQEVTFVYEKLSGTVVINCVDSDTGNILKTETLNDLSLTNHTIEVPVINGYTTTDLPRNVFITDWNLNQLVSFNYTKTKGTLKVRYVDKDGNELLSPKYLTDLDLGEYNESAINVSGYLADENSKSIKISLDNLNREILFVYTEIKGTVTVHYQDVNGNPLADDEVLSDLNLGLREVYDNPVFYKSSRYVPVDGNIRSVLLTESNYNQEVTFLYKQVGNYAVDYVDEEGNHIIPYYVGMEDYDLGEYTVNAMNLEGYVLNDEPTKTFNITEDKPFQKIVFNYRKIVDGSIKVNYVDDKGVSVYPSKVISKLDIGEYKESPIDVEGYTSDLAEKSVTVTKENPNQVINFVYTKDIVKGSVTINYNDEEGDLLYSKVINDLDLGEHDIDYDYVKGYEPKDDITNTKVNLTEENPNQIVNVTYKKIKGSVSVKFKDKDSGALLSEDLLSNLDLGLNTAYSKDIEGYLLDGENFSVVLLDESKRNQEVVFYYNKIPELKGTVTVNAIDKETGNVLDSFFINDLDIGNITVDNKSFSSLPQGYLLDDDYVKEVALSKDNLNPTIVFNYKKIKGVINVKYQDSETGEVLSTKVLDNLNIGSVNLSADVIDGYTVKDSSKSIELTYDDYNKEVVFSCDKIKPVIKGSLTVNYIDKDGKNISSSKVVKDISEGNYVEKALAIDGYVLSDTINERSYSVSASNVDTVINFVYNRIPAVVTVKYVDSDGNVIYPTKVVKDLNWGEYTESPIDVTGYLADTGSKSVVLGKDNLNSEIVFEYNQLKGSIKVNYVDEEGNAIYPTKTTDNLAVGNYTEYPPVIEGYTSNITKQNVSLSKDNLNQVITFNFVKDVPPVEEPVEQPKEVKGSVTVKYVNITGNISLLPDEVYNDLDLGKITKHSKVINGFDVYDGKGDESNGYNASGLDKSVVLTEENPNQEIVFYYNKVSTGLEVNYVDKDGNKLSDVYFIGSDVIGNLLTVESKTIEGYKPLTESYTFVPTNNKRYDKYNFVYEKVKPVEEPVEKPSNLAVVDGYLKTASGEPVINTKVTIHSTPRTTYTDENGYFKFDNVEYDNHELFIDESLLDKYDDIVLSVKTKEGIKEVKGQSSLSFVISEGNATVNGVVDSKPKTVPDEEPVKEEPVKEVPVTIPDVPVLPTKETKKEEVIEEPVKENVNVSKGDNENKQAISIVKYPQTGDSLILLKYLAVLLFILSLVISLAGLIVKKKDSK